MCSSESSPSTDATEPSTIQAREPVPGNVLPRSSRLLTEPWPGRGMRGCGAAIGNLPASSRLAAAASLNFSNLSLGSRPFRPAFSPERRALQAAKDTGESSPGSEQSRLCLCRLLDCGDVRPGWTPRAQRQPGERGRKEFQRHLLCGKSSEVTHSGNTKRVTFLFFLINSVSRQH